MAAGLCKCGALPRAGQRNCLACHSKAMRKHRKEVPQTEEQRLKSICRSYANVYVRRGKLIPKPCEECGSVKAQKHHEDYTKPLQVKWLCRACHLRLHVEPFKS
jgi:hypothetical protein